MTRRVALAAAVLLLAGGCGREAMLDRFSSPADQAAAQAYIALLRNGDFEPIESATDVSLRSGLHAQLERMAAMIPEGEPTSVKVVGAQQFSDADGTMVNTTFEYSFGEAWLLINVALRRAGTDTTIVGFNVVPQPRSLEARNRFTLAGKQPLQYAVLGAAVSAVALTLYALVVCLRAPGLRRRWLWVVFVVTGVGRLGVNWTTGQWSVFPFTLQLFSASAFAPLYGAWTIAASVPLGAIVFLLFRRRLLPAEAGGPVAAPEGDGAK